jgi:hypothetical protein
MGCDVHMYAEKRSRDPAGEPGAWTFVAPETGTDESIPELMPRGVYESRNYILFAALAGVRNSWNLKPVVAPRGVPADASPEYAGLVAEAGPDGHSHSWLTLAELLRHEWGQLVPVSGYVDRNGYGEWLSREKKGAPREWWHGHAGTRVVSEPAMLRRWADKELDAGTVCRCLVSWEEPLMVFVDDFVGLTLHQLHRHGAPDDVRIVFFFDN